MTIEQVIDRLQRDESFMSCVTEWRQIPAQEAEFADFPAEIDERLVRALGRHGIKRLYSHQAEAIRSVLTAQSTAIVTPTSSGKTLCYNIPVLHAIIQTAEARALYLFPTKALAQDQIHELHAIIQQVDEDIPFSIKSYTFDGDTPASARKAIKSSGHIVVTNPDMLHTGILPHHTQWVKLFENLRFIVIDEIHQYRGVFGSHMANVLRRLKRICQFYNSTPVFICCSATIANPRELAEQLTGEKMMLVDKNGAPHGKKHFILYNPPVVNRELGIRRSFIQETQRIAADFIGNDLQTIVFTRSRMNVEILLTYLRETMRRLTKQSARIRGYRGGYLPLERRDIERGLRDGSVIGVVSTNALELGIDIGQLQVAIIAGYPGTISSALQQSGRAGRRQETSLAIIVSSSSPLDQYIANNPHYFFERSPESAVIDADNLLLLLSHLKCAAFELPFSTDERFGLSFDHSQGVDSTQEILQYLEESGVVHLSGDKWHWMSETYPAESISLRSAAEENIVIIDRTNVQEKVIGEIDLFAAQLMVHQDAIYLHEGKPFHVDALDWPRRKAYVHSVKVDYYTDAELKCDLKVLDVFESAEAESGCSCGYGEVVVTSLATMYKKIKFHTHENIGWGKIHLPECELHTTAFWHCFPDEVQALIGVNKDELGDGLKGLAHLYRNIAPLFIMGDRSDISALPMVRSPFTERATIYIWEQVPGGIGQSKKLYHLFDSVIVAGRELIQSCGCQNGCPSCVGPQLEVGERSKEVALRLLDYMLKWNR
ncbi:DEAD/DEAH box helicase [candidate division KSB1 bacterium]|nr:MAG: DEAD/DEAH box helicase [candidate division KSB1 bacterium]